MKISSAYMSTLGKLVSFLSSEDASFITEGDYLIDGGMSVNFS